MVLCCSYSLLSQPVKAQETTTEPALADLTNGVVTNGACVGGTSHANILPGGGDVWGGSNAVQFGACSDQFAISVAINQALQETGISVDKLHYRWKWINGCYNITKEDGTNIWCAEGLADRLDENYQPTGEYADQFDTLTIQVNVTDANGNVVQTKTYDYDTWYHWAFENAHSSNEVLEEIDEGDHTYTTVWQITEDFIEFFNHQTGAGTIYTPNQLGNISFVTTGQDNGQEEGYYGPVVKDGEMWFTYTTNPCDLDTLYHPTCNGYAEAYTTYLYNEACLSDPLYDSGCTGYPVAYKNNQCTINPLYDASCSGYDEAFLSQQCDLDDLYSSECTGYAAAFLDQQCTLDSLYDMQCPMYQIAYFNQQCDMDSQYDLACPNYQPEVVEEITAPPAIIVEVIPEPIVIPEIIIVETIVIPQIEITPETAPVEEITTQSIEIEIAQLEAEIEDPVEPEPEIEEPIEDETAVDETTEPEKTTEPAPEKEEDPEKENSESAEDETNDEPVEDESVKEEPKVVEKPKPIVVKKKEPTKEEIQKKKDSRSAKIKQLIADKIAEITKEVNSADTIEEQMVMQAKLVALIAFVPDFDYAEREVPDTYFYPPEPTIDHEFSRFFLNDPKFGAMEDLQYPNLR